MSANPLQQKIQIARRQLGLDDDAYRAILERVTGQRSTKRMARGAMARVLDEMKRLGFEDRSKKRFHKAEVRQDLRYIHVLWRLLAEADVVLAGRSALNSFVCASVMFTGLRPMASRS